MNQYEVEVLRTASEDPRNVEMTCFGLAGETGEVIDLLKKVMFHGKELDRNKLVKELGDLKWYYTRLCLLFDISQEEIETENVKKLRARYPNGFNFEDANRRADESNSNVS